MQVKLFLGQHLHQYTDQSTEISRSTCLAQMSAYAIASRALLCGLYELYSVGHYYVNRCARALLCGSYERVTHALHMFYMSAQRPLPCLVCMSALRML